MTMANAIRSAKSSTDWNSADLLAYNITISPVPPDEFFPLCTDPPLGHLDPAILTASPGSDDTNLSHAADTYLGYLDLATRPSQFQENAIVDLARATLDLLGYNERNTLVVTHYSIPLTICGDANREAQTDVCVLHRPGTLVLLVLVVDRTIFNEPGMQIEAEPQVIAGAIAAFQFNNAKREGRGFPRLDAMTVPCVTMTGIRPTFYLVPVTRELSDAVLTGLYPATQTRVLKCVTTRLHAGIREGMEDIEYRKLALKRLLAFKTLAKSHWERISEGL